MRIGEWGATKELNELYREIRKLGLEQSVAELDTYGLTVVPPRKVATPEFVDRLYDTIMAIAREKTAPGVNTDLEILEGFTTEEGKASQTLFYLMLEDRVFEEALMNPTVIALVTYLLGQSCLLSSATAMIKGPGDLALGLHCDAASIPSPFPQYAQFCNATYALTDYTKDNGALYFVPGSHRLCRSPSLSEFVDQEGNDLRVPVEAPKGSLIVWHGNTWHGAFDKTTPGFRVNLILFFCRMYLRTSEAYGDNVPQEMFDRNPERFARLMGRYANAGWKSEGPDYQKLAYAYNASRSIDA